MKQRFDELWAECSWLIKWNCLHDRLNERQAKVIARMFREGVDGFEGGLSAENYISITRVSRDRDEGSSEFG
jgi:hypothetical protein